MVVVALPQGLPARWPLATRREIEPSSQNTFLSQQSSITRVRPPSRRQAEGQSTPYASYRVACGHQGCPIVHHTQTNSAARLHLTQGICALASQMPLFANGKREIKSISGHGAVTGAEVQASTLKAQVVPF
jgi:hypothetical protein